MFYSVARVANLKIKPDLSVYPWQVPGIAFNSEIGVNKDLKSILPFYSDLTCIKGVARSHISFFFR